ncbi:MAG: type II toxin-antitoxin system RelE/ParE family toxin [Gammaproteobacteria bacterium]
MRVSSGTGQSLDHGNHAPSVVTDLPLGGAKASGVGCDVPAQFQPRVYRLAGDEAYREIVIKPWRIVYRIDPRSVYVLGVLGGRRDLAALLLERLARCAVTNEPLRNGKRLVLQVCTGHISGHISGKLSWGSPHPWHLGLS